MRSRHGATVIPSHDPECGKSAIAANNQRQKPAAARSEPERNLETHSSGDDRGGAGSWAGSEKKKRKKKKEKKEKKHAPICFGFCPSLQSCPAPPGFRVKPWCCGRVEREEPWMGSSAPWGQGQLCCPLSHLSHAPCGIWAINDPCARSHPRGSAPICCLALSRLLTPGKLLPIP